MSEPIKHRITETGMLHIPDEVSVDLNRYKIADLFTPPTGIIWVIFWETERGQGERRGVEVATVEEGQALIEAAQAYWEGK